MKNYICIDNQQIELTDEQVEHIKESFGMLSTKLSEIPVGETVKIGSHEMVVLEQRDGETALIRKDLLPECMAFGTDNNFKGSFVEAACKSFAEEIAVAVGEENIVLHDVDLTSDDGLDDFGQATGCRASLLTANMYRRYVRVLDKHKVDNWWWLATAFSIPPHDEDNWVLCVSPSGCIDINICNCDNVGVRPFCILKSNIFVSK